MITKPGKKGFTLIELIAAVAMIAIAFLSILKINSQSLEANTAVEFYTKAPLLARKLMAEWETCMAATGTATGFENALEGFEGFEFEIDRQSLDSRFLFSDQSGQEPPRLVKIICTLSYDHGRYTYRSKTIKYVSEWAR